MRFLFFLQETFNLNDSLASIQSLNIDYDQIDIDDS